MTLKVFSEMTLFGRYSALPCLQSIKMWEAFITIVTCPVLPVLPFLVFLAQGKENLKKSKDFLFPTEPLKSLERKGKTHKNAMHSSQGEKKQGNKRKQGKEGHGRQRNRYSPHRHLIAWTVLEGPFSSMQSVPKKNPWSSWASWPY